MKISFSLFFNSYLIIIVPNLIIALISIAIQSNRILISSFKLNFLSIFIYFLFLFLVEWLSLNFNVGEGKICAMCANIPISLTNTSAIAKYFLPILHPLFPTYFFVCSCLYLSNLSFFSSTYHILENDNYLVQMPPL
jgi:hypothetical protein